DAGVLAHPISWEGSAGFVLFERPIAQASGEAKPNQKTKRGNDVKPLRAEKRLFGLERQIMPRTGSGHPWVDLSREESDGDEEAQHGREKQSREMLTKAANGHGPAGIEKMMHDHQEQPAEAEA